MSKESILSYKLFLQQEYANFHNPYESEMQFYNAVRNGDFSEVKKHMNSLNSEGMGQLSKNPLRNMKYHLIITIAMITRFCIEGGLQSEEAYTLSDIYIQQLDSCSEVEELESLHQEVIFDFTDRMAKIRKNIGLSRGVIKASEYVYNHLNEKISLENIAKELKINKSYLCELFKKETGITIFQYATKLKIQAAEKMLVYTEYAPTDISNYFAFSSHSHFISTFKKHTGVTPNEYRKLHYHQYFEQDEYKQ
ncbi:helix-turn-helix domain-containing protein [Treponema sp.]|uniref:helix-turn-helix domain-containing protein n=1 Tax=Treponema sp. TaxID=166 RepID=UPI00298E6348|nr:helix-turn-helix domain-containing protein [Treponema sp.]MCQ2242332.1 helix-turn-helix domain-containing protein [Treponema sp.]